jgi:hypothetical protein
MDGSEFYWEGRDRREITGVEECSAHGCWRRSGSKKLVRVVFQGKRAGRGETATKPAWVLQEVAEVVESTEAERGVLTTNAH